MAPMPDADAKAVAKPEAKVAKKPRLDPRHEELKTLKGSISVFNHYLCVFLLSTKAKDCIDGCRFALVFPIVVAHFARFGTSNLNALKLLTQDEKKTKRPISSSLDSLSFL